jgi:hypothetical protein
MRGSIGEAATPEERQGYRRRGKTTPSCALFSARAIFVRFS